MKSLPELFTNNEQWRHDIEKEHPGFFKALGFASSECAGGDAGARGDSR